jgi:hypothetical protein
MREYKIYKHPTSETEAVKVGWSWPAFLFFALWAFAKGLWTVGIAVRPDPDFPRDMDRLIACLTDHTQIHDLHREGPDTATKTGAGNTEGSAVSPTRPFVTRQAGGEKIAR